jgi:hypothetical protein
MDGPKNLAFYLEEFSSRHLPEIASPFRSWRHDQEVIETHFSGMEASWLRLVVRQSDELPPLSPRTRVLVLIPARFEARRIEGALNAIFNESKGLRERFPNILETVVLNNWFKGEFSDDTARIVEEWALQNTGLRVHCVEIEWPSVDGSTITACRRLLADVALFRAMRRPYSDGPLYLVSEDADVEWIETNRTSRMLSLFDQDARIDAIRGIQHRSPKAVAENHLLMLDRVSWFFAEQLMSQTHLWPDQWERANFYWNRVVTGGWNTAFSASSYAEIRGYTPDVPIFEDMDIGQRISVLRGRWKGRRFIPNMSTVARCGATAHSSAARAALALGNDKHLYSHGGDLRSFYAVDAADDPIRSSNARQALDAISSYRRLNPESEERFQRVLSELHIEILRIHGGDQIGASLMAEVLALLGLGKDEASCDASGLHIRSMKGFAQATARFERALAENAGIGPSCLYVS